MEPDERGMEAYVRGYEEAKRGVPKTENPYRYYSVKRGGAALAGWWDAGYSDAVNGKPRRW